MSTGRKGCKLGCISTLCGALLLGGAADIAAADIPACIKPGSWMRLQEHHPVVGNDALLREVSQRRVVLLGERHDNPDHHAWQLQVLAGLYALHPDMAIGFEMFPRSVQPVLDRWVAGELGEQAFLTQSGWRTNWNFDPDLYLPLFNFARINRIPMYALNVDREVVATVRSKGWAAMSEGERGGIGDPAPAARDYLKLLAGSFLAHRPGHTGGTEVPKEDEKAFHRFVEGQLLWDGAMAQKLAAIAKRERPPLVVGVMGTGHIAYHFGVPQQLKSLGIDAASVLVPWDDQIGCEDLQPGFADAIFGLAPRAEVAEAERPRLGVYLEPSETGVKVAKVVEQSVAAETGLKVGDYIVELAGGAVSNVDEVIAKVQTVAFGTWLPLTVRRGEERIALVAKFPPGPSTRQ